MTSPSSADWESGVPVARCPECEGDGVKMVGHGDRELCDVCRGEGFVRTEEQR